MLYSRNSSQIRQTQKVTHIIYLSLLLHADIVLITHFLILTLLSL